MQWRQSKFIGGGFFSLTVTGRGRKVIGTKGQQQRGASWGGDGEPPPHHPGVWERGPGRSSGKFEIWCNLRVETSKFTTEKPEAESECGVLDCQGVPTPPVGGGGAM